MDIAKPNAHGVLPEGQREIVASRGRAYAAISFALGEDGKVRYGVELHYSIGGVITPIRVDGEGFATLDDARTAGLMELLRHWHEPNPSDANSVRDELADMRRQPGREYRLLRRSMPCSGLRTVNWHNGSSMGGCKRLRFPSKRPSKKWSWAIGKQRSRSAPADALARHLQRSLRKKLEPAPDAASEPRLSRAAEP